MLKQPNPKGRTPLIDFPIMQKNLPAFFFSSLKESIDRNNIPVFSAAASNYLLWSEPNIRMEITSNQRRILDHQEGPKSPSGPWQRLFSRRSRLQRNGSTSCQMTKNVPPWVKTTHCPEGLKLKGGRWHEPGVNTACCTSYLLQVLWSSLPLSIISWKSGVPGSGVRIRNCIVSIPRLVAKSAVLRMVSTSSVSAPSTNMPWIWMPWSLTVLMQDMMSSLSCFLLYALSVAGLMDSMPIYNVWQPDSAIKQRSSVSLATSVLTWADHRVLIPSAIIPLRISLALPLLAVKLSSTMNLVALDIDAAYSSTFS